MKALKTVLKIIKSLFVLVFLIVIGIVAWVVLSPVGPDAKKFCEGHSIGSLFDRAAAIHEMSAIGGGYIVRILYSGGELQFHYKSVVLQEGGTMKLISQAEALSLTPHADETFRITSTGFAKRSCEVGVTEGKVISSRTWTWD